MKGLPVRDTLGAVVELELKLALPASQAERLRRHPALRPISPHRAVVADLDAIYFDTPALDLQRRGVAVRLREAGGHWVQTVKTRGEASGALHRRLEWEFPSDGKGLDFRPIDDLQLRAELETIAASGMLQASFRTRFRRWARLLVLPDGTQVELALDLGRIEAGAQIAAIAEVELELKAGRPEALFELALALQADLDLQPEPRSKAERGYALASGQRSQPLRARAPALEPRQSPALGCAAFLGAASEQLQRNLAGACEGADPEFLHQARVALRRLRATLTVFRAEIPEQERMALAGGLRLLMRDVGPAREWDVFCTETLPQVQAAFPGHAGLEALGLDASGLRQAAQARAAAALASRAATRLQLQLGLLASRLSQSGTAPSGSLRAFARTALSRRARRSTLSRAALAARDTAGRHEWRIALKKLRYAADFLLPVLDRPGSARRWLAALSRLQDILGTMNDAAGTTALLELLPATGLESVEAQALVRGFLEGASHSRLAELESARRSLERAALPWKH